jgi:hypothetical protein
MLSDCLLKRGPLPEGEFATMGIENTAYVKEAQIEGRKAFVIYAADGTPLTAVDERDLAFETIRQHDMLPVSVH